MISLKRWRLFPRSLRQLVIIAFLLVLLPLLVLAYQAYDSLDTLSEQAADINKSMLVDARRSEAMSGTALAMERSYRQYCVLDDSTLATLYQSQHKQYAQMLEAHRNVLPDPRTYQLLSQHLIALASLDCVNSTPTNAAQEQLTQFAQANAQLLQMTVSAP